MDKLRRVLSGEDRTPDEESSIIQQINEVSTLSWSTRIKGFCICFVIGIVLSFLGSLAMFLPRGIVLFAVFYTLGNIMSMARQQSTYRDHPQLTTTNSLASNATAMCNTRFEAK